MICKHTRDNYLSEIYKEKNSSKASLAALLCRMVDFKVQQRRYRTSEKTVVSTTYGPIKGVKRKSIYGQSYFSFERIPFAKPPVGELRYRAPQPPEIWTEVKSCTSQGPKPLQKHFVFEMTDGSEDCLYLNVYTKNVSEKQQIPWKQFPISYVYFFGYSYIPLSLCL